jgi:hypothetical protein
MPITSKSSFLRFDQCPEFPDVLFICQQKGLIPRIKDGSPFGGKHSSTLLTQTIKAPCGSPNSKICFPITGECWGTVISTNSLLRLQEGANSKEDCGFGIKGASRNVR